MRICHDQIPLVGLWVWLYHDLFMSCHACQEYCCFSIKIWCVNNGENKTAPYCQTQQEQIKLIWLYRFDAKFSIKSYLKTVWFYSFFEYYKMTKNETLYQKILRLWKWYFIKNCVYKRLKFNANAKTLLGNLLQSWLTSDKMFN